MKREVDVSGVVLAMRRMAEIEERMDKRDSKYFTGSPAWLAYFNRKYGLT